MRTYIRQTIHYCNQCHGICPPIRATASSEFGIRNWHKKVVGKKTTAWQEFMYMLSHHKKCECSGTSHRDQRFNRVSYRKTLRWRVEV